MGEQVEMPADLVRWIERATDSTLVSAVPIGSGTSRRIWGIRLASGEELVVRHDTGSGPVAGTRLTLAREADVYRALASTPVLIPRLRSLSPAGDALLVERVSGEEHLLGHPEESIRSIERDFARRLGELHLVEPATLDLGAAACPTGLDPTLADIELWREIDETRSKDRSSAAVGVALDWLAATAPATTRPSLCHGDAGSGNFLHDGAKVTALLDWEFAHVGDAHDDLAWVVVRNQLLGRSLDLAATFAAWADTTGWTVDPARVEWFRALVLVRMLISCDAAVAWAGPDAPNVMAQVMLQPYLGLAVFEALRRAGRPADDATDALERAARTTWEASPIADLLGDPVHLEELGALS